CSCFSLGTVSVAQLQEGCSADASYALLNWQAEKSEAGADGELTEALNRLSKELYEQQCQLAVQRFAPLLRLDDGVPTLQSSVIRLIDDYAKAQQILKEVIAYYSVPAKVDIPIETCLQSPIWRKYGKKQQEAFRLWALNKKVLPLDEPKGFNRDLIIKLAKYLIKNIDVARDIQTVLDEYKWDSLEDLDTMYEALARAEVVELPLHQGFSVDEVGYGKLQQKIFEFKAYLPGKYVLCLLDKAEKMLADEQARLLKNGIKHDDKSEKALTELELLLNRALSDVRDDVRFKEALRNNRVRMDALLEKMGQLRCEMWTGAIKALGREQRYWEAYLYYCGCMAQLNAEKDNRFGVYSQVMRMLPVGFGVELAFRSFLPDAVKKYSEASRQALEIANKPAIAYAICSMAREMCRAARTDEEIKLQRDVETQFQLARERVLSTVLRRTISLGEMFSAMPGIGVTYRQDLENELRRLLDAFGLGMIVVFQEQANADYTSTGGNVANLEANESSERQSTRTVERLLVARRVENPDYVKDAEGTADMLHSSRIMFLQDRIMQVIRIRQIEPQAHVRVFFTFKGPGFSKMLELNEFYSKSFFVEESHPINDVKLLDTQKYYAEKDVPKASEEPQLKNDRVWTQGQMLDWARKGSLEVVALMLLVHINEYPLYLQNMLEKDRDRLDAASKLDLLAQFSLLCDLQKEGDDLKLLDFTGPVTAKNYNEYLGLLHKQRSAILDGRKAAADRMHRAASEYVQAREAGK
ncbi:MAG: hypothetical protein J5746_05955, partial [Victivallales bacterium]|nr:hypothetical protein [Victivallales bacterium]